MLPTHTIRTKIAEKVSEFVMPREREVSFPGADKYPGWLWIVLIAAAAPTFIVFLINGEHFRALISSLSVGVVVALAITLRSYITSYVYWAVIALCTFSHIVLVLELSVEHRNFPGTIFTPAAVVDLLFWQYVFVLTYRTLRK